MNDQNHHLDTLQDIKQMMERSSRFISLSGLSGIAAGSCALVGAWFAYGIIESGKTPANNLRHITRTDTIDISIGDWMGNQLVQIAAITFIAAFILAFVFTSQIGKNKSQYKCSYKGCNCYFYKIRS